MNLKITSKPDPEYPDSANRHLWLLVGGDDFSDGAHAFYLGADSDIDGDPIAEHRIDSVVASAKAKDIPLNAGCHGLARAFGARA